MRRRFCLREEFLVRLIIEDARYRTAGTKTQLAISDGKILQGFAEISQTLEGLSGKE